MSSVAMIKKHFTVARREIGYLRFILESYDELAFFRTLDASLGLIEVAWPPSRSADAESLLAALALETGLAEAPSPQPGTYPEL